MSLCRRFLDGSLTFAGKLLAAHAREVETKVRCSTRVVRRHKRLIVAGFG